MTRPRYSSHNQRPQLRHHRPNERLFAFHMLPTAIISEILKIGATLLSIFARFYEAKNSPAEVQAAVEQLHQDLKDKERAIDAVLSDPNATPEQHKAALEKLRMSQS